MEKVPFTLHLSDAADEETRKAIAAPLVQYNESRTGPSGYRPLVIELRDSSGAIVGGHWGASGYGWLYTQLLALPESVRGKGLGRQVMAMAQHEALERGCAAAWVDTFEFQARGFYEKLGYSCFAVLPDYPPGYSRFFLKKRLP